MLSHNALTSIARIFKIITLLSSRRPGESIGRAYLAECCQCSTKTIQRDVDVLIEGGAPIRYDYSCRSYMLPELGWTFPITPLTATDVMALALARAWLARSGAALPFAAEIDAALYAVTRVLTRSQQALLDSVAAAACEVGGTARDYSSAPIAAILQAITQQLTARMLYESRSTRPGEKRERHIDPYRVDLREGRYLELQAWCHENHEVRTFALDRIAEFTLTERRFTHREWDSNDDGVVGGLRGGDLIEVDVWFDPIAAPYAREHRWAFEAAWQSAEPSGSARMQGQVYGTDGIVKALLRWGSHAEALGGEALRSAIHAELNAMSAMYGQKK